MSAVSRIPFPPPHSCMDGVSSGPVARGAVSKRSLPASPRKMAAAASSTRESQSDAGHRDVCTYKVVHGSVVSWINYQLLEFVACTQTQAYNLTYTRAPVFAIPRSSSSSTCTYTYTRCMYACTCVYVFVSETKVCTARVTPCRHPRSGSQPICGRTHTISQ